MAPLSKLTSWITPCLNLRKFYHLSLCFLVYTLNKIVRDFLRIVRQIKKKLHVSRACAWHIVSREGVLVFIAMGTFKVLLLISRAMLSGFTSESLRIHSLTQACCIQSSSFWISQATFLWSGWFFYPVCSKLKVKAGLRSQILNFVFPSGQDIHAAVPCLTNLGNRFL